MQTAANDVFLFKDWPASFPTQFMKMRIDGEMIQRYHTSEPTECVLYVEDAVDFSSLPASVQAYLESNRGKLEKRAEKRRRASKWWTFTFPLHKELYHLDKIWCSYRAKRNAFTLDDTNRHVGLTNTTVIFGTNPDYDLRYILALLNSKALDFRYKTIGKQTGSGVYEYLGNQVSQLPIPRLPRDAQQPFIALVETLIAENRNYHAKRVEFLTLLRRDFPTLKTTALSEWWNREWPEVKDALARQRVHFRDTIAEEDWVRRFNRYSGDLRAIQSSLRDVDARLDALVCQLYQLTPTEIAIMEEETTNPNA